MTLPVDQTDSPQLAFGAGHDQAPADVRSVVGDNGLVIRQVALREVEQAIKWPANGRAVAGLHDAECFLINDPQGFLGAFVDDRLVAVGWLIAYSDTYAFLGGLYVAPDLRGRRYGSALARALLSQAGHRTVAVEAPRGRQKALRRFGFQTAGTTTRYTATVAGETRRAVVSLERVPFEKLASFDARHFGAPRTDFLKTWTTQPGTVALAKMHSGRMLGYGVMRPWHGDFRIGPLFAEGRDVAEDLFQTFAARANGATVVLDVPDGNPHAQTFVEENNLAPLHHTVRMYAGAPPSARHADIFGITAPELG
jgi:GNAT superfamily N-acetyltransferase